MARHSKSSQRWLERQRRDYFAKQALDQGRVSRAHFKLEQLDQRFKLLKPSMNVLELGAAPGGWTQFLEQRITQGTLVAVDPLPITAAAQTHVIEGSIGEPDTDAELATLLDPLPLDLVLSDMAPNISGVRSADQAQAMYLVEIAEEAALKWLKPGGDLVVKVFQGEGVDAWVAGLREHFARVQLVKPKASRPESREVYAVARQYRG
ncbi:MAG: RlmE family RNA methyltransferase [Proteobacteria bacterium]|nr:RlmE family RNA methyltransferase [Pseudomonadota bacterium]